MQDHYYLWTLVQLLVLNGITSSVNINLDHVQFGKHLEKTVLTQIFQVSLVQCQDECLARSVCKSYNYWTDVHICEILSADGQSGTMEDETNVIFSAKAHWNEKVVNDKCYACQNGEKCTVLNNYEILCTADECFKEPTYIPNTKLLGNMNHVGSKRMYVCKDDFRKVNGTDKTICGMDGQWSPATILCVHKCFLVEPPNHPMLVSSITKDIIGNYVLDIECEEGFMFRGLSTRLKCSMSSATYDFSSVCCHIPDGPIWTQIYRINTHGYKRVVKYFTNTDPTQAYQSDCQFQHTEIITNWGEKQFNQIKVEIFDGETVAAWMRFNAVDTTTKNWFRQGNLLASSWTDLSATSAIDYFRTSISIPVQSYECRLRYAVIEIGNTGRCDLLSGWLFIAYNTFRNGCNLPLNGWPVIYYASNNVKTVGADNFKIASRMEISVAHVV